MVNPKRSQVEVLAAIHSYSVSGAWLPLVICGGHGLYDIVLTHTITEARVNMQHYHELLLGKHGNTHPPLTQTITPTPPLATKSLFWNNGVLGGIGKRFEFKNTTLHQTIAPPPDMQLVNLPLHPSHPEAVNYAQSFIE